MPISRCLLWLFLLLALPSAAIPAKEAPALAAASAAGGYELPPPALQALVDAPRPPQLAISPRRDLLSLTQTPSLPGIDVVAQPELKLAGLRINPRTYAQSRFSFGSDLWLLEIASGKEIRIQGLPQPLSVASSSWSPDQNYIAFNQVDARRGSNELWLIDVKARSARRLISQPLNTVAGRGYRWMPDSQRLLVQLLPEGQGEAPASDGGIPVGPNTQQTQSGNGVTQIRTYQDLLKNETDARLFEHYLRSQTALVDLAGNVARLGVPALTLSVEASPDGRYLLNQRIERPFSYLVPYRRFPRRIEVLDLQGRLVHEVAKLPLVEGLPTGNDAVATGVRDIEWRGDAPATLVWAEAQDGGDPARNADIRDAVLMQAAPFERPPVTLARLGMRYGGIYWGGGELALLSEYWWKTRQVREWRIAPDHADRDPQLIRDGSYEDRYNDPGRPVTVVDENGQSRLLIADGESIFRRGDGASPEGDRPFLDRVDLRDGASVRLFHSQPPYYEAPHAVLDSAGQRVLTARESQDEPANFYVRDLQQAQAEPRALTRFPHPTPQLKGVSKEQIRYKRGDGVDLTGTLYLPPGYDARRDGPLPMLMWAYPSEFKSAEAASQVTDSPYRFNAVGYWGPQAFLAMGYAVLDDFSVPIVGEGDKEPNDTYVPQLVASAEAAVDEVVRRGVADRQRIAVGGHSYGAFMTANLLAHTRLFKAGIARSGAYNRTLTPFGFQAEERNFWQAGDVYGAMSPFNHADSIKDALLLIHGEQDNNSGTFPIQSERMYAAIKGLGGNARLVMLPNESHGYRARESILHMLAESNRWLETYLKQPAPAPSAVAR
ncbi:S9 family peptidase [Pseudoxanthomonas wuyuanensis]|uniref:Glutamyl peptidase. Serine peptidase. MEROPS family S09D n=1 Tax=Pseudoxanthomonas wuyuanensis TaxID=1073196 RepID=A0A286D3Y3_9GAMM|nr:prolyl oligopeptidase family serine peptidase [Pseudoxanthomonas wuyuanensis]KAF1719402.1 S9 family peptidase [Pseudoxanthomonas wuyuanensis]SOD53357.1 glutamyl peptidase. Serine peptidase. MEROPS family S09D [Pseudoxanthomonas wuyuanensis]